MDELLGIIIRLLTETQPITYEAVAHLRPYTQPHVPIAVAAAQSPSGMVLAGKHGAGVLSVSALRGRNIGKDLGEFWKIAEQTAEEHGNTMDREEWRVVLHVHLAETRKDAIEQARVAAGRYQREYFEDTLGFDSVIDGPPGQDHRLHGRYGRLVRGHA